MERLTKRIDGGIERVCRCGYGEGWMCSVCDKRTKCNADIFDRLAAYEDTGLEPEQIEAMKAENERLHKENFWLTGGKVDG